MAAQSKPGNGDHQCRFRRKRLCRRVSWQSIAMTLSAWNSQAVKFRLGLVKECRLRISDPEERVNREVLVIHPEQSAVTERRAGWLALPVCFFVE
jgi:hypothetical protein